VGGIPGKVLAPMGEEVGCSPTVGEAMEVDGGGHHLIVGDGGELPILGDDVGALGMLPWTSSMNIGAAGLSAARWPSDGERRCLILARWTGGIAVYRDAARVSAASAELRSTWGNPEPQGKFEQESESESELEESEKALGRVPGPYSMAGNPAMSGIL
jgi:hypothetical protein